MLKIALMGHGVVGSGVVEVLEKNKENIRRKIGREAEIRYILDLRDFPDSPYHEKFIKDFNIILNDSEIEIVVEVMGGIHPAYDYVKACLAAGKSVVSSNKELVAQKGAELLKIAREKGVFFLFEASVGGGIPIIRPLHQCLAANELSEVAGILNGTTNFILTKMIREDMTFADALALAQKLGYAERDPSADVDGLDSCRKICILASLAFGRHIYPDQVHTEGIRAITREDVEYACDWGGVIKLIGWARRREEDGRVEMIVSPAMISHDSQLSQVDDVFNGILVKGDATGDVVFYGKGAGKLPTASAVVADIIDIAKGRQGVAPYWEESRENQVADYRENRFAFYLRCQSDTVNVSGYAAKRFGGVTSLSRHHQPEDEFAFVTPVMQEKELDAFLETLAGLGVEVKGKIRVMDL